MLFVGDMKKMEIFINTMKALFGCALEQKLDAIVSAMNVASLENILITEHQNYISFILRNSQQKKNYFIEDFMMGFIRMWDQ